MRFGLNRHAKEPVTGSGRCGSMVVLLAYDDAACCGSQLIPAGNVGHASQSIAETDAAI